MTDSDAENSKTQTWLEFALECSYIEKDRFDESIEKSEEVGKLKNYMINILLKFDCD